MRKKFIIIFSVGILSLLFIWFAGDLGEILKIQSIDDDKEKSLAPNEYYRYEIIEQENDVIYLDPGEIKELELTLKNIGKFEWELGKNSKNIFVLGTYLPRERESIFYSEELDEWKDPTQIYIKDENGETTTKPDETVTFKFKIKAPETPGAYRENFAPIITGIKNLNNTKITFDIVVEGDFSSGYDYEIIEKSEKETLSLNGTREIKLKVKNTGEVPWYSTGPFPLELIMDDNISAQLFGLEATGAIGKLEMKPGEIATFLFNISSPGEKGSYEMEMKLAIQDLFVFTSESIIWDVDVAAKQVALTFDDGYGDIDAFIDVLNEEGVKGTFFILGCVAQNRPEEMKRIMEEGHLLASHSYNHPDFRTLSADSIRWQLNTTRDIIKEITGIDTYPYFRYPYGAYNSSTDAVLEQDGWQYFHWTNGTGDWKFHANTSYGRQHIYKYATLNPPDQAIVLMHVISRSTLAVLPDIIDWYRDRDYAFVTVDELE